MSKDDKHVEYVQKSRRMGVPEDRIRRSLEGAGWDSDSIDYAFQVEGKKMGKFFHLHLFKHHIPFIISALIVILIITSAILLPTIIIKQLNGTGDLLSFNLDLGDAEFVYGSWPALENVEFFKTVKAELVEDKMDFIETDLSKMTIRVYKNGEVINEAPIISKGKEGSWWETPAGIYSVQGKEVNHFSSFGQVNMPWSMPFQGNFFIHGWPTYPDGSPVSEGYSGGCIRLSTEDAEEIYSLSKKGMPVLVFEDSFSSESDQENFSYALKTPDVGAVSYLSADIGNNFVFSQSKSDEKRSIASITKLMTALIAVEYINVERDVTISPSMLASTSIPRLKSGDRFSVLDLLSVLLQESSNEAALAISTPLGEERFINLMNAKAAAIGMSQTNFVDTSGINAENISSPQNLFMLAKYLYYNRSFVLHTSIGNENRIIYGPSRIYNTQNLNNIPGTENMVGGKIGLSTSAGDSMLSVFEVEIDGEMRPIAIIVLGSDDAKRDTKVILEHIKSNYGKDFSVYTKDI